MFATRYSAKYRIFEPLGTLSGLIDILFEQPLPDMNYDDRQGHPMWFE
ncbi:hypothetical protein ACLB1E_26650 [Escherichia coli]